MLDILDMEEIILYRVPPDCPQFQNSKFHLKYPFELEFCGLDEVDEEALAEVEPMAMEEMLKAEKVALEILKSKNYKNPPAIKPMFLIIHDVTDIRRS